MQNVMKLMDFLADNDDAILNTISCLTDSQWSCSGADQARERAEFKASQIKSNDGFVVRSIQEQRPAAHYSNKIQKKIKPRVM